jgi:hypothetical protein
VKKKNLRLLQETLKKFRKFEKSFFEEVFFFFLNKIFHGNLPEARGCRDLEHTQYELERFGQFISISEN